MGIRISTNGDNTCSLGIQMMILTRNFVCTSEHKKRKLGLSCAKRAGCSFKHKLIMQFKLKIAKNSWIRYSALGLRVMSEIDSHMLDTCCDIRRFPLESGVTVMGNAWWELRVHARNKPPWWSE